MTGLISLQSKKLSRVFSSTIQKHQFFSAQSSLWSNSHIRTGKTIALMIWTFVGKVMSLLFNMLSTLVIAFMPRSKCLLILWLQSTSAVIFGAQEEKEICCCFHFFPIYSPWSDGTECLDLSFLNVKFEAGFSILLFHLHQEAL